MMKMSINRLWFIAWCIWLMLVLFQRVCKSIIRTRTKQITVLRILKLSHQNRIFIMEVLPLDGAKALKGTGKKREKWPLVDVVSEFILFETMQMKPQISIRKYA